jgi:hypothetical protein
MVLIRYEAEPDFPRRILWTDEASFKLYGRNSRHNSVYWSDSNPHEVIQEELNVPGITFWAGIWSGGIVGPYIFYGTESGESYLEMILEVVLRELGNSPLYDKTEIIWQQDCAPQQYSLRVRKFFNNSFPEWIGLPPPKSCDFSLWGIMKNKDFS